MSKYTRIIAGLGVAAGFGMAVLPASGAFAASRIKVAETELEVELGEMLSLTLDADSKTAPTIAPGETTSVTTTAKVITNIANGYTLRVTASNSNINHASGTDADSYRIAYKNATDFANGSGWHITYTTTVAGQASGDVESVAAGQGLVMSNNGPSEFSDTRIGDEATVTYNIKASNNQAAGQYTGTVTYTATAAI